MTLIKNWYQSAFEENNGAKTISKIVAVAALLFTIFISLPSNKKCELRKCRVHRCYSVSIYWIGVRD